jgi:hypothetical protein
MGIIDIMAAAFLVSVPVLILAELLEKGGTDANT